MHFKQMVQRKSGLLIFCVIGLLLGVGGCALPTFTTARRMASEGYCIWYPAESGIEPGQIWLYDGTLRSKFAERPNNMPLTAPQRTLSSIEGTVDAGGMLSGKFTELAISKAGEFDAELFAGSVRGGTFELGPIHAVSIPMGADLLKDAAANKYGPAYAKALQMVRDDTPGLVLVAAIVQVERVDYRLYCEDPYQLLTRLPRIREMIHGNISASIVNDREIHVSITPVSGLLTIGVTPVRGDTLLLSADEARSRLAKDLVYAQKQSYALRIPIPKLISAPPGPIISGNDTSAVVVEKYRAATRPATQPTTQSGSSGRVLIPVSTRPSAR